MEYAVDVSQEMGCFVVRVYVTLTSDDSAVFSALGTPTIKFGDRMFFLDKLSPRVFVRTHKQTAASAIQEDLNGQLQEVVMRIRSHGLCLS